MPIAYIVAITAISIVSVALAGMVIAGFIQGIREHREHPEEPSYGESLLFPSTEDADEVFYDAWGIKQGYSKTDAGGNKQYYDAFGTQIGRSERRF